MKHDMIKVNVWQITGYKGRSDYDGPQDNNIAFKVALDARLTKDDVECFFLDYYSKKKQGAVRRYRNVVINAELFCEKDFCLIEEKEQDPESEFWETLYDTAKAFVESYVQECEVCRNKRKMDRNLTSVEVLIPVKGNRIGLNQLGSLPCFYRLKDFRENGRQIAKCRVEFTMDGKLRL